MFSENFGITTKVLFTKEIVEQAVCESSVKMIENAADIVCQNRSCLCLVETRDEQKEIIEGVNRIVPNKYMKYLSVEVF